MLLLTVADSNMHNNHLHHHGMKAIFKAHLSSSPSPIRQQVSSPIVLSESLILFLLFSQLCYLPRQSSQTIMRFTSPPLLVAVLLTVATSVQAFNSDCATTKDVSPVCCVYRGYFFISTNRSICMYCGRGGQVTDYKYCFNISKASQPMAHADVGMNSMAERAYRRPCWVSKEDDPVCCSDGGYYYTTKNRSVCRYCGRGGHVAPRIKCPWMILDKLQENRHSSHVSAFDSFFE